jgi:6-phosphofructokinase 1
VISAATIEAINSGLRVVGLYDGYRWLARGDTTHVRELTISDVSRIHFDGGSILRTSRENPTKSKEKMDNVLRSLEALGLSYLVTIGGDDTAFSASQIVQRADGKIRVAHVPKTIDNDLPLPGNMPTFGYQTARHIGVNLVQNIMEDSRTTNRWYIVVSMGRKAGHLALGIGKAVGATLTVIGEEFETDRITVRQVCDVIEGAILKRRVMGREDGVVVVAEGIAERFDVDELRLYAGVDVRYDEYGHIRLAEIDLGRLLKTEIEGRFNERGDKMRVVDLSIGYELRCAPPIAFDYEYCRDLGYSAIRYLLTDNAEWLEQTGAMICVDEGKLVPLELTSLLDPKTGKMRVKMVDIHTESYAVAREYMIRLEKEDFENPVMLEKLAEVAKMTPEAFRERFGGVVGLR